MGLMICSLAGSVDGHYWHRADNKGRLFRSIGKGDHVGEKAISRFNLLHMIMCRAKLPPSPIRLAVIPSAPLA